MLWLLAAVTLLLVTALRPEMQANERAALSGLVPLYFLSLPAGHFGLMAVNRLKLEAWLAASCEPGIFAEGMMLWSALVLSGYLQWFVLLPWLSRRCGRLAAAISARCRAR